MEDQSSGRKWDKFETEWLKQNVKLYDSLEELVIKHNEKGLERNSHSIKKKISELRQHEIILVKFLPDRRFNNFEKDHAFECISNLNIDVADLLSNSKQLNEIAEFYARSIRNISTFIQIWYSHLQKQIVKNREAKKEATNPFTIDPIRQTTVFDTQFINSNTTEIDVLKTLISKFNKNLNFNDPGLHNLCIDLLTCQELHFSPTSFNVSICMLHQN